MACSVKYLLSFAVLGIIGCLTFENTKIWKISPQSSPSDSSRFYVLHDWQDTFSHDSDVAALPAVDISDIMLKTMGILKDGADWAGVQMSNLFSRPHATALFVVDGLSSGSSMGKLNEFSFTVDQTGLTGCTCGDMQKMFTGDNVASHLNNLFDQHSETYSVSANTHAAKMASAQDSHTTDEHLKNIIGDIQSGDISLSSYGLESLQTNFDLKNEVDVRFVAELILIRQSVEHLSDLPSYVNDGAPDVFIFTVSTLRSLELRYGTGSSKIAMATKLVKETIDSVTKKLVTLYDDKILVQALVLEWNYVEFDRDAPILTNVYNILSPFIYHQSKEEFISHLPQVILKEEFVNDIYLCRDLHNLVKGSKYKVTCPLPEHKQSGDDEQRSYYPSREIRSADQAPDPFLLDNDNSTSMFQVLNTTVSNLAEARTDNFSAVFLITFFIVVSLGLALLAISWALWTMDPGRDSIIYRQVSDPTGGMKMQ